MTHLGERPLALPIHRWRGQHDAFGDRRTIAADEDLAQVTSKGHVLLGLLVLDDLLRCAAEGQLVALPVGPKQLLELATRHGQRLLPPPEGIAAPRRGLPHR